MIVSLKNLVNELYAKDISQKIQSSFAVKQKKGEFIGAFPPYGYRKSPEDKHRLVVDPETAPVVREIFKYRLQGFGHAKIARILNQKGIANPSTNHYRQGRIAKEPCGTRAIWQARTIKDMIANPIYAGHMAQRKSKTSLIDGVPWTRRPQTEWMVVQHKNLLT